MASQGAISRELFQTVLVDYTLPIYKSPAPADSYITPTPGYSTSFLFVRTPVGVEVKLPPITGVVNNDTLPAPVAGPIHFVGIIPVAFRPITSVTIPTAGTIVATPALTYFIYNANGDIVISSTIAGTGTFAAASHLDVSPVNHGYSASSVLEVTV
jgi:hypothetical protein